MIAKKFTNKKSIPGVIIDDASICSAVVIPVIKVDGKNHILFERRASDLPDHPGDICFPGGVIESGETAEDAAVRETCEELLISKNQVKMLGPSYVLSQFGLTIFPYVAYLEDYKGTFSQDETGEVFTVPLEFFIKTNPEKHNVEWVRKMSEDFPYDKIVGGKNYKWRNNHHTELFYEYDDKVIWGITARIVYYALIGHAVKEYALDK